MTTYRSRRLEALLGAPLSDVTAQNVQALVEGGVQEAFDLDFKALMYGSTDADKRELAADVAALANTAGGVILIGIEEDEHARASAAPGVPLSDECQRRAHSGELASRPGGPRRVSTGELRPRLVAGRRVRGVGLPRTQAAPVGE